VTGIDDWQHPLLVAFRRRGIDVTQVLVTGPSQQHAPVAAVPDAVVCVSCNPTQHDLLRLNGLAPEPLDASGARPGRGDDATTTELWLR
jgi:hypothetical protein